MERIVDLLSNPIIWTVVLFIAGIIFRTKLSTYLKLIDILIEAIERFDKEIKDIISPETEKKLTKIKVWIAKRVGKTEGKVLDNVLQNKGYLNQKGISY